MFTLYQISIQTFRKHVPDTGFIDIVDAGVGADVTSGSETVAISESETVRVN